MNFKFYTRLAYSAGAPKKPPLSKGWLFVILIALFIPHGIDVYNNHDNTIAPDLLLRTIGSHLQEAGKPIYEYKWQEGDPTGWLNPYPDKRVGVNGVVSTPFLLWLHQPAARLNYCTIKTAWLIIQQVLLFASMWLCCLTFASRSRQIAFIVVAAIFFMYSRNWLLHLYNGQVYIVHAFVFSLAGYIVLKFKNTTSAVVLFVLMSAIRPFFITALLPFFKFTKKQFLFGGIAAVFIIALTTFTTTKGEWMQYSNAMMMYSKEATGELKIDTSASPILTQFAESCTTMPNNTFKVFGAGCLFSLQHYLQLISVSISSIVFFQIILAASLLFMWWLAYKRRWLDDLPKQLVLALIFYQLCELITPASRNPYNMVQWLPAIAWLFSWADKKVLILLVVGLCLNHDWPFRFNYGREIGEIIMFYALIKSLFKERNRLILG